HDRFDAHRPHGAGQRAAVATTAGFLPAAGKRAFACRLVVYQCATATQRTGSTGLRLADPDRVANAATSKPSQPAATPTPRENRPPRGPCVDVADGALLSLAGSVAGPGRRSLGWRIASADPMIARVTLEMGLRKEFDYFIPTDLAQQVDVGARVH